MRQPNKRNKPRKFPPGFRFRPTDEELIRGYLRKKLHKQPLPYDFIQEVDVYKFTPQQLVDNHKIWGQDGWWYFFTPRERRYPNGNRPSRTIESSENDSVSRGGWKATGSDKTIFDSRIKIDQRHGEKKGVPLGKMKTLVYYEAKDKKTDWIMYEYLDSSQEVHKLNGTMKLDAVVLCSIHKKPLKTDDKEIVAVPEAQGELQRYDSFASDLLVEAANTEPSPTSDVEKYFLLEYSEPSTHQLTNMASATDHQYQGVMDHSLLTCSEHGNQAAAAEPENVQNASIASSSSGYLNLDDLLNPDDLDFDIFKMINWEELQEIGNNQDPPAEGP